MSLRLSFLVLPSCRYCFLRTVLMVLSGTTFLVYSTPVLLLIYPPLHYDTAQYGTVSHRTAPCLLVYKYNTVVWLMSTNNYDSVLQYMVHWLHYTSDVLLHDMYCTLVMYHCMTCTVHWWCTVEWNVVLYTGDVPLNDMYCTLAQYLCMTCSVHWRCTIAWHVLYTGGLVLFLLSLLLLLMLVRTYFHSHFLLWT